MNVTVYLFFSVLIAFVYGANSNEENALETGAPTSELPSLEQHEQSNDGTHKVVANVIADGTEAEPPYFVNIGKMARMQVKPVGNMIILKCKAGGNPTPNVTWYKNNEAPRRNLGSIHYGQWSLRVEDLVSGDSGIYKCVVCNSLGCINYNYTVDVVERYHNRPILLEPPQNKTVVVGSNVNFTCTFLSDLPSQIVWVTGVPGKNGTVQTSSAQSQDPEVLELVNVTTDSEGWYTCVASNGLGITSASAYLKVVDGENGQREERSLASCVEKCLTT